MKVTTKEAEAETFTKGEWALFIDRDEKRRIPVRIVDCLPDPITVGRDECVVRSYDGAEGIVKTSELTKLSRNSQVMFELRYG